MSRWGKPIKNKKRKDPRYFLNELSSEWTTTNKYGWTVDKKNIWKMTNEGEVDELEGLLRIAHKFLNIPKAEIDEALTNPEDLSIDPVVAFHPTIIAKRSGIQDSLAHLDTCAEKYGVAMDTFDPYKELRNEYFEVDEVMYTLQRKKAELEKQFMELQNQQGDDEDDSDVTAQMQEIAKELENIEREMDKAGRDYGYKVGQVADQRYNLIGDFQCSELKEFGPASAIETIKMQAKASEKRWAIQYMSKARRGEYHQRIGALIKKRREEKIDSIYENFIRRIS